MTPKCPNCKRDQDDCVCVDEAESLRAQVAELRAENAKLTAWVEHQNTEIQRWKYSAENPNFEGRLDTWQMVAGKYRAECDELKRQRDEYKADAERYRWLVDNSYDRDGFMQFHVWKHTWEPHSQTGVPTEWKCRVRGPAIDAAIDAALAATKDDSLQALSEMSEISEQLGGYLPKEGGKL